MAFISVLFDPELDLAPNSPLDDQTGERAMVRNVLASLVFDGAAGVSILEGMHRFTVRRIQQHVTPVLVDATLPDEDTGELTDYRLVNTNRRLAGPFGPDGGRQSCSHHLIRFGEQVLDLAVAALAAKTIHDIPLSGTLRWRFAEGDILVPLPRPGRRARPR